MLAAYESFAGVDIIHDHTALGPLIGPHPDGPSVVATCHGPFDEMDFRNIASFPHRVTVVAISHAQKRFGAPIPIPAVIHHGIDLEHYSYGDGGGGPFDMDRTYVRGEGAASCAGVRPRRRPNAGDGLQDSRGRGARLLRAAHHVDVKNRQALELAIRRDWGVPTAVGRFERPREARPDGLGAQEFSIVRK
ncbi:glycosyltransferase family 4 protein [Nocardia pseudobrasiliensis]|uniref:glycosyltransferase family 4 protein n=1 Tax=Nocardia pseudobrasiliensis TaxID=45979 RepID=UPI0011C04D44|nr:glycosyltransferase family 4 protein [Nocardia pseudobrasiliensis]